MRRVGTLFTALCLAAAIAACTPTPSPTPVPTIEPQDTPSATATAVPTEMGGAPEATFREVGSTATLNGQNSCSGKAVVAGLQTLIIVSFSFDGKVPADLRLVNASDPHTASYVLAELTRPYDKETLQFSIPQEVGPGTADSIAVYDTQAGRVLAIATFE